MTKLDHDRSTPSRVASPRRGLALTALLIFGLFLTVVGLGAGADTQAAEEIAPTVPAKATRADVQRMMDYYRTIQLTPEQQTIFEEGLTDLPAACCSKFSAATCCCECNLSRSLWGMSKFLITEHNYDATRLRAAAEKWFLAVNPNGYEGPGSFDGQTCMTGRCGQPMQKGGCGGMLADQLIF